MKVKIKSFNGDLPSYLTVGRVYKAKQISKHLFSFVSDDGRRILAIFIRSEHLNGGSWEVVE